jgi:hypothetical protein
VAATTTRDSAPPRRSPARIPGFGKTLSRTLPIAAILV